MTPERIGLVLRALRHRRAWTQAALGARVGCSASVVSRVERGNVRACSLPTLHRLFEVFDARVVLSVQWRGGELDRLLDADHALLGERWAGVRGSRWEAAAEVTYSEYGERGSLDELAFDPSTGTLLVVELKTGLYDGGATVSKLDEKARLAPMLARRRGWAPRQVVPVLVVAESRTNRRRIEQHERLFGRFACRGRAARAWLRDPQPLSSGSGVLLFVALSDVRGTTVMRAGRQRVRPRRQGASVARAEGGCAAPARGA
ncbi:MAG TPA: helix-turn-helix transcriptional regulator [Candidatus Limnocylindrales bacterium]|nr:helix-turn-helix transcriptional regulator [Candidatus Limnocylindrales bacterium]